MSPGSVSAVVEAANPAEPSTWSATLREAQLNGIGQRWADTAVNAEDYVRRPVVLFMHGWPESWFSWRHQLRAAAAAGYVGVAPDMRGYGGTYAPAHSAEYTVYSLAGDMLALLQHLGVRRAALVGHDHGANLGWKLALLHPRVFPCYVAMSVPYGGRPRAPPLETFRSTYGDERQPETDPSFFYMLHHCLPSAGADYARGGRAVFQSIYGDPRDADPPEVTSRRLFVEGVPEPAWRRERRPQRLLPWISQGEVDYYVSEFERSGWEGGLNWYRVLDLDWVVTPQLDGRRLEQPVAFIAGSRDPVLNMYGGVESLGSLFGRTCVRQPTVCLLEGAGHWIQQERPDAVNTLLFEFLTEHLAAFAHSPNERASSVGPSSRL